MLKNYNTILYECKICHEPVSNPICPNCLIKEVTAWLTLYPDLKSKLIPRLTKKFKKIEYEKEAIQCIKCGNEITICPLCFTNSVLTELNKINAPKMILKEFLQFFYYDFQHNVYADDAEDLGIL
jgi:ferredoxin